MDVAQLEQLLRDAGISLDLGQLASAARQGSSFPASKSFIATLKTFHPCAEDLASQIECAVCLQAFEEMSRMHELPCRHLLHPACVLPWLATHNTCPVCRHELPSDDPGYEARKAAEKKALEREKELADLHDSMFG